MPIIQNLQEGNYSEDLNSKVASFGPSAEAEAKRQKDR